MTLRITTKMMKIAHYIDLAHNNSIMIITAPIIIINISALSTMEIKVIMKITNG